MTTLDVLKPEAQSAASRSQLYALLSRAFRYPSESFYQSLGQFMADVQSCLKGLPFTLSIDGLVQRPEDQASMEQTYTQVFELGDPKGPPCSIYEGEYGSGRLKVMEDVLRFYDHFGLRPAQEDGSRDRPDHVATELEFMHLLAFQEAAITERGRAASAYRSAQRDFLRFHLLDLTKDIAGKLVRMQVPFYSGLAGLAYDLCQQDLRFLAPA